MTTDFFLKRLFLALWTGWCSVIELRPDGYHSAVTTTHQDPLPTEVLSERGRAERGPLDNSSDLIPFRSVLMALDLLGQQGAAWPHLPHVLP